MSQSALTGIVLLASVASAGLTVDDSLNRYSLYGRKIVKLEYSASTSKGGWIGSDSLVQIDAMDTLRSTVTSGKDFQINNGADWIWGDVRVARDMGGSAMYNDSVMGTTYVGRNLTMAQLNILKGRVYTGGQLTVAAWNHNYFNGSDFFNNSAGTNFVTPTTVPGLTWGVRPEATPYAAWTFPDTTFSMSSINIATNFTTPKDASGKYRWTCGSNAAAGGADLVALKICATNDTILPPGNYGDVNLWYGSTLFLDEGAYSFNKVTLPPSSGTDSTRLLARQPNGARTVILIKGKLDAQASGRLNVIAPENYVKGYGTDSAHFAGGTLMIYAEQPVSLGVGLELWATLVVPNHSVTLNDQVHLFGQILADSILVKNKFKGTDGAFIPYYPNRPKIKVANFGWTGPEGALGQTQSATFTLQMDHLNGLPVTVWYHTVTPTRDTVVGGKTFKPAFAGDYDLSKAATKSGSASLPPTATTATFSVNVYGNNLKQANRYFLVVLDSIVNGTFDSSSLWNGKVAGGGFILDDDATPTLQITPISQTEGTGTGTKAFKFHVTLADSATGAALAPASSGGADFTWSTIAGTAAAGTDFVAVANKAVSWPAGKSSDTLTVQVYQDSSYEANETFQVSATPTAAANVQILSSKAAAKVAGTILNDDSMPTLSIGNISVVEGAVGTFTAKLSVRSGFPACFDWKTVDNTAKAALDYTADSATNVCIAAGSTSTTFKVTTLQDALYEGSESFKINATVRSGITATGSVLSATGTITDDDSRPRLWISDTTIQRPSTGTTTMKFVVSLLDSATGKISTPSGLSTSYSWSTVAGTALADSDYLAASGTGTIAAGATTDTIRITIVGDARYHAPLSFSVALASPTNVASVVSRLTGVGTILSAVGRPVLVASDASVSEGDAGRKPIGFVVSLRDSATGNPATSRIDLPFTWSSTSGTAQVGTDFVAMDGSSVVPAGSSQTTVVTDSVIGNLLHQANRSFSVAVAASGADLRPGSSTVTGTIVDDDPAPVVRIDSVSIRRDTIAGSKTPLWFHVRMVDPRTGLSTTSGLPVSIDWNTVDGSAKAGLDYVAASGKLTIPVGSSEDSISVSVLGDTRFSPTNSFLVKLGTIAGGTRFADSVGTGTIYGGARKPVLALADGSIIRPTKLGDSIGLPFAYYLVDPKTGLQTTSRTNIPFGWITRDSSAQANRDFKGVNPAKAATLAASKISDTLKVQVLGLGVFTVTRVFIVKAEPTDTTWVSGDTSRSIATGTIIDSATEVGWFATRDTSVAENQARDTVEVKVRLQTPSASASHLPVVVDPAGTTARSGVNFRLLDDTAYFAVGDTFATVRVLVIHDTTYSSGLKVRLQLLSNIGENIAVMNPDRVTLSISESDPPPKLSFLDTVKVVREADTTISVVLTLDRPSSLPVAGTIAVLGGSAKSGVNYKLGSGGFAFPALTTIAAVPLAILSNHRYGPDLDVILGWGSVVDSANVGFDAQKRQERVVIVESDAKPAIGFALDTLVVQDVDGAADARIELSTISDSVALAGAVYDASRSTANRIGMTTDSAYAVRIDTGATSTVFHFVFGNDGKVGSDRFVRLVLRNPLGANLGTDSVLIVRIRNTNRAPVVVITTPVDSSRLSDPRQRIEWTVGGVPQPPTDTVLAPGWNTITRCATDTAGNTACHTHHVWGDFTAPAVQVFKITGPNTHNPAKDTTWWGDKARTRFGNDTIWYWVRDSIESADGKSWRVVVDTHFVAVSHSGDGLFPTQVKACDSVGNCGVDTGWIDLKQSKPVVDIQTPPEGAHVVAGTVPVGWSVTDAGKTSGRSDLETVTIPGTTSISRCYTDDVGNTGCDTNKVVVEPIHVVKSYYVDTDGDGRVDAAIVELDSRWTGTTYPSFDFRFGDSLRTGNTPNAASPFYSGPSRGTTVVVGKDTLHVEAGPVLTDSVGNVLRGPDGYPLTGALGDTAYGLDGKPLRDSTGRILYEVAGNGEVDSTRFLVPIVPPFAFGMTGFDSAQQARMSSSWTEIDSTGKKIPRNVVDTFAVGDKVAPVIVKAEIHRVENYTDPDTLFVTPSEKLVLGSGRDWLQVGRCPTGMTTCTASQLIWEVVPDSLVTLGADGRYWFLVQPESLSIRPNYQVRFRSDVSDSKGNGTDTTNLHWNTLITGKPRPDIVELVLPTRIPVIPSSEANHSSPGGIILRATKGLGGSSSMRWWEPGTGYLSDLDPSVRKICPVPEYCNGPSVYINRPVRLIVFIYDMAGTFVSHRTIDITQKDIDAMEPDQLDRLSVEIDWNHRTEQGQLVASGVYLWRIVSYLQVEGKALPMMTNQLYKVGVKVEN